VHTHNIYTNGDGAASLNLEDFDKTELKVPVPPEEDDPADLQDPEEQYGPTEYEFERDDEDDNDDEATARFTVNPGARPPFRDPDPLQKTRLYLMSSVCGSGKTWVSCKGAMAVAKSDGVALIVQETKELIAKTRADMIWDGFNCVEVHGDTTKTVICDVLQTIKDTTEINTGLVIFITHAAFSCLPAAFPGRSSACYFYDEAPAVVKHFTLNMAETHGMLTDYFDVGPSRNGIDAPVKVLNRDVYKRIAINERDDIMWDLIQQPAWGLWSENWECFVNLEQYRRLERGEVNQLTLIFELKPSVFEGYRRGSVAAAFVEDSYFYNLFRDEFNFVEDPLCTKLRQGGHRNGHLNSFFYFFEGDCWSKEAQRGTLIEGDPTTNLQRAVRATKKHYGKDFYLWHANNCEPDSLFDPDLARRLPSKPEGRNDFDSFHNVVILSASNPTPQMCRYLKNRGLTPEEIQRGCQFKNLYQVAMRCSARTESPEPKRIACMMRKESEYLAERMGAGRPPGWLRMDGFDSAPDLSHGRSGRPRKADAKSARERKREARASTTVAF
jgi:hypothetical protein